jgi:ribosomal protein S26
LSNTNTNNNLDVVKCQKCGKTVAKSGSRSYSLAITNTVDRSSSDFLRDINKITLCLNCDNARTTSLTQYIQSGI